MKKNWIPTIISISISIIVTVIVTWYTISRAEKQSILAEQERERKVIENVVQLIEEHIINKSYIDQARLERIISTRKIEEKIAHPINSLELIRIAEYNILNSRHLDFSQKSEYKLLFDSIYNCFQLNSFEELLKQDSLKFPIQKYSKVKETVGYIENGKKEEALKSLSEIVLEYSADYASLENKLNQTSSPSIFDVFSNKEKWPFIILMIVYLAVLLYLTPRMAKIFRKILLRKYDE